MEVVINLLWSCLVLSFMCMCLVCVDARLGRLTVCSSRRQRDDVIKGAAATTAVAAAAVAATAGTAACEIC